MLQKLSLNLADRLLLEQLLANQGETITVDVARLTREIRRRFDLRGAAHEIEQIKRIPEIAEVQDLADMLLDFGERMGGANPQALEFLRQRLDLGPEVRSMVTWDDLLATPAQEYTIDSLYLTFIGDQLKGYNWNRSQQGGAVSPAMIESVADLADRLAAAVPAV